MKTEDIIFLDSPEFGAFRAVVEDGELLLFVSDLCSKFMVRDRSEAVSNISERDHKVVYLAGGYGGRDNYFEVVNIFGAYMVAGRATAHSAPEMVAWLSEEARRMSCAAEARGNCGIAIANPDSVVKVTVIDEGHRVVTPRFSSVPDMYRRPAEMTISSVEMAKVTGKRHDHVMRDIKIELEQAGIDAPKFGGIYLDARNREKPCYYLPRNEFELVITSYSAKYRFAVIRRWRQLEEELNQNSGAFQVPRTMKEALLIAMDLVDKNTELKAENLEMKPKAEYYDVAMASDDLLSFKAVCSIMRLPFGQNTLFRKLREMGVLGKTGAHYNLPTREYEKRGLFYVRSNPYIGDDGRERVSKTTLFTQKGAEWAGKKFNPGMSK